MKADTLDPSRFDNPLGDPRSIEWMTREEWISRFPDEFVAVIDPVIREGIDWDITAGYVVFHSADEDEAFGELKRLRPKCGAVRYTTPDENQLFLL